PRPRPWQGRALPTELFSQFFIRRFSLKAGAYVHSIFDLTKFFEYKFELFLYFFKKKKRVCTKQTRLFYTIS
ncbi:MAG TPA: hypothetical protein P5084_14395, partial [Paludibacter sp.]|nr:hypothetical protein [Paludibacter sp.]